MLSTGTIEATIEDATRPPVGHFVAGNFFDVLGLAPAAGRLLSASDDRFDAPDAATVAVIGYGFWQRQFGGDPNTLGRTLTIDRVPFTIVGVLPRGFTGLTAGRPDDFYIPMASEPRIRRLSWLRNRQFNWLTIVGRLKPGDSPEAARANVDVVFRRYLDDFAATVTDPNARRTIRGLSLAVESARAGLSSPRRELARPVLILMGAVSLVLLIACANVVNLVLARGMARRREIGLRLAIGASRGRLVRQLLAESVTLGLIGGLLGLALATWGGHVIAALLADGDPTVAFEIGPDGRVLLFTAVISLGSALVAGLVPAIRLSRTDALSR